MTTHRLIRCALTQTKNAYPLMPAQIADLPTLQQRLDDIRNANVYHNVDLIAAAAAEGAHVICLGELCTAPYFALYTDPMWLAFAEDAAIGPSISAFRTAARNHHIIVIAPIFETDARSGKRFNTAVVIDENGEILGKYRKTHIPCGHNDRGSFHETLYYGPSDGQMGASIANIARNPYFPVFHTSIGNIGVAICYDRHFEGVMHSLKEGGAELVFCPAITFGKKSRQVWHQEFFVDAVRHGLFIGGSNRLGCEPPWTIEYFGESYFCGPQGLCPALSAPKGLVMADLNLAELTEPDPSGWNLPRDIRFDIYSPRVSRK